MNTEKQEKYEDYLTRIKNRIEKNKTEIEQVEDYETPNELLENIFMIAISKN